MNLEPALLQSIYESLSTNQIITWRWQWLYRIRIYKIYIGCNAHSCNYNLQAKICIDPKLQIYLYIMNKNFSEPCRQHVSGFFSRSVSNIWHQIHAFELSTNTIIDTFGFPPISFYFIISVTLMTNELFRPLLDNFRSRSRCDRHIAVCKIEIVVY